VSAGPQGLDKGVYRELVRRALAEDMGWGDVTTGAVSVVCSPSSAASSLDSTSPRKPFSSSIPGR
jgi:hypothetical protein